MTDKLTQLRAMTEVVADTGDIEAIRQFSPQDATTNPSLLFKAAALPHYASLLTDARTSAEAAGGSDEALDGLEWRDVGPYRGGRVTAVTGVPGRPNVYFMGATGGGVWKTENAGRTWENLSDGWFEVGTIGSVAVAESDPNVIYVGTGESPIRGVTTSHGDGVWKSTDGGQSWVHIGLPESGQISKIQVHPGDPDIALVGVQGQIWGPNEERGVYRTTDGGTTWQHVLKVGPRTGASDLRMDPTNPRVLYAAMWNHGRTPWFIHSGGTDGGIYKSTDGGDNWNKLEGGLPENDIQTELKRINRGGESRKSTMPSLLERLDNIGHQKPLLPKPLSVTAARFYLGSACDTCIELIDKRSLDKLRSEVIKDCSSEEG